MHDGLLRNFSYRYPRFKTELAMDFISGQLVVPGVCDSISEAGLSGRLADHVLAGEAGIVTLYHEDRRYSACASISHIQGHAIGFNFLFATQEERTEMRALVAMVRTKSTI